MAESARPLVSPWAIRFGVSESYPWKTQNKSGFHPSFPDVDITHPGGLHPPETFDPASASALPLPSDAELDQLFLDEKYQRREISGHFAWQAVLLDDVGINPAPRMNVSERNWLPLFAKKRWYNLERPLSGSCQGTLDGRFAANATWSVDDPLVWSTLSPAVELASRLLWASLRHPFLDAILGVQTSDLYPTNLPYEGLNMPPVLAMNKNPRLRNDGEIMSTLNQFAEKIIITFMPPGMPENMGVSSGMTALGTDPHIGGASNGYDYTTVMINTSLVWRLLQTNISSGARAQATLILAITLVHEMVHAIYNVKKMLSDNDGFHHDEPFYAPPGTVPHDSAWVSELGVSWEQAIIGGFMTEAPNRRPHVGGFFVSATDVPNYELSQTYENGIGIANHAEEAWNAYAIPSFVSQRYGSDDFWYTQFPRYGLPAIRFPKLVRTVVDRSSNHGLPQLCELDCSLPVFRTQLEELGERFKTRISLWRFYRPWYYHKLVEWEATPHSHLELRDLFERFRVAHREGNEWTGQKCYRSLGADERWGVQFAEQGFLLDQDDGWIDQAVGYLMMVIMPVRLSRYTRRIPWMPKGIIVPSTAATFDAIARSVTPFEVDSLSGVGNWEERNLTQRNIPFDPNSGLNHLGDRMTLMMVLRHEIPIRQRMYPLPDAIFQELKAMFNNIELEEPRYRTPDRWLSAEIKFELPAWKAESAKTQIGYSPSSLYVPYNHTSRLANDIHSAAGLSTPRRNTLQPGLSALQTPGSGSSQASEYFTPPSQRRPGTPSSDSSGTTEYHTPPSWNPSAPEQSTFVTLGARVVAQSARRAAMARQRYYTVGEIADHNSANDLWVIADDGAHGYNVYDATGIVERVLTGSPEALSIDDCCERTLLGLKALPYLRRVLEEHAAYVGKAIIPIRRQELAERDGRHGRPFWISVGADVFDISGFPFETDSQRDLMRKFPGGNPWAAIVKDGTVDHAKLFEDLKPYRCAVIASQTPEKGPGPSTEFHFTQRDVSSHIYPEESIYTIIRGQVYNLTGYIDFHPGGDAIFRQCAGKDSTIEFDRHHTDADRCLSDYDYLRVGRLVDEKTLSGLTHQEVALNGYVYDLSTSGSRGPPPQLLEAIDGLGLRGTDITAVLNDWSRLLPLEALSLLPHRPDLISAKVSIPLAAIDLATLDSNDGRHVELPRGTTVPHNRAARNLQMPLWRSYDGLVYDMTAASRWGPEDVRAQLRNDDNHGRGVVLTSSAFATRLQREYSHRVIGELIDEPEGYDRNGDSAEMTV